MSGSSKNPIKRIVSGCFFSILLRQRIGAKLNNLGRNYSVTRLTWILKRGIIHLSFSPSIFYVSSPLRRERHYPRQMLKFQLKLNPKSFYSSRGGRASFECLLFRTVDCAIDCINFISPSVKKETCFTTRIKTTRRRGPGRAFDSSPEPKRRNLIFTPGFIPPFCIFIRGFYDFPHLLPLPLRSSPSPFQFPICSNFGGPQRAGNRGVSGAIS